MIMAMDDESFLVIDEDGIRRWFQYGFLHRTNGPAFIGNDGLQCWYRHGQRHREDGPALIHPDGSEHWYRFGQRHREDGPAIMYNNGELRWYINDTRCHNSLSYQSKAGLSDEAMAILILKYGGIK